MKWKVSYVGYTHTGKHLWTHRTDIVVKMMRVKNYCYMCWLHFYIWNEMKYLTCSTHGSTVEGSNEKILMKYKKKESLNYSSPWTTVAHGSSCREVCVGESIISTDTLQLYYNINKCLLWNQVAIWFVWRRGKIEKCEGLMRCDVEDIYYYNSMHACVNNTSYIYKYSILYILVSPTHAPVKVTIFVFGNTHQAWSPPVEPEESGKKNGNGKKVQLISILDKV